MSSFKLYLEKINIDLAHRAIVKEIKIASRSSFGEKFALEYLVAIFEWDLNYFFNQKIDVNKKLIYKAFFCVLSSRFLERGDYYQTAETLNVLFFYTKKKRFLNRSIQFLELVASQSDPKLSALANLKIGDRLVKKGNSSRIVLERIKRYEIALSHFPLLFFKIAELYDFVVNNFLRDPKLIVKEESIIRFFYSALTFFTKAKDTISVQRIKRKYIKLVKKIGNQCQLEARKLTLDNLEANQEQILALYEKAVKYYEQINDRKSIKRVVIKQSRIKYKFISFSILKI